MRGVLAFAVAAGMASLAYAGPEVDRQGTSDPTPPDSTIHSFPTEDFAVVPPAGWIINNQSATIGLTSWFQGNPTVFQAQSGASNSYAGANFNNTTGTNTISDWLITPVMSLAVGDVVHFWTRTVTTPAFPDRLQLRESPTGGSNPGVGPTSTGDFSQLLVDINPTYSVAGYPSVWTEFTFTIGAAQASANARLAFRYFVENGGPSGANSDYIGVDTFSVTSVPEPTMLGLAGLGGLALARRRRA